MALWLRFSQLCSWWPLLCIPPSFQGLHTPPFTTLLRKIGSNKLALCMCFSLLLCSTHSTSEKIIISNWRCYYNIFFLLPLISPRYEVEFEVTKSISNHLVPHNRCSELNEVVLWQTSWVLGQHINHRWTKIQNLAVFLLLPFIK